ncbi:dephospho-CoA kinase [Acinetobacter sp. HY1485]|uniref:dephospho-CoA kinase n=1 Tax=Acinetobacter sp. HY1485 TaxID=2970918 RepID=UPI0022B9BEEB|nr:dephospho-CoA kinase [Acinetobacter sp. HY1485]
MIIGLTGGIGSGKSAASDWFASQGITVVDADIVAREVVQPHQPALAQIIKTFGHWTILPSGELDRKALRNYIFKYPKARKQLEAITHPLIRQRIIQQLQESKSPYTILVSPLLLETDQYKLVDRILLIDTSVELQQERTTLRDGQTKEQIQTIIDAQMSRENKQQRADDIVLNDQDLSYLFAQLNILHQHYLNLGSV